MLFRNCGESNNEFLLEQASGEFRGDTQSFKNGCVHFDFFDAFGSQNFNVVRPIGHELHLAESVVQDLCCSVTIGASRDQFFGFAEFDKNRSEDVALVRAAHADSHAEVMFFADESKWAFATAIADAPIVFSAIVKELADWRQCIHIAIPYG